MGARCFESTRESPYRRAQKPQPHAAGAQPRRSPPSMSGVAPSHGVPYAPRAIGSAPSTARHSSEVRSPRARAAPSHAAKAALSGSGSGSGVRSADAQRSSDGAGTSGAPSPPSSSEPAASSSSPSAPPTRSWRSTRTGRPADSRALSFTTSTSKMSAASAGTGPAATPP